MRATGAALCVAALALGSGCASNLPLDRAIARGGRVRGLSVRSVPTKGHQIALSLVRRRSSPRSVDGELLAVDGTHLWLLLRENKRSSRHALRGTVVAVERALVVRAQLELYDSGALTLGIWSASGALVTVALAVVFPPVAAVLPLWAIGAIATVHAATTNDLAVEPGQFGRLFQFARFPAGLPATVRADRVVGKAPRPKR